MLDDTHTMGPSSFALLRNELEKKDPNKQPPSKATVYKESRKRVSGRAYKKNNENTKIIEQMDALQSSYDKNTDVSNLKDPYNELISNGRLHLYGRTVTKSKLKEVEKDKGPSYTLPSEFLEGIKTDLVQQLAPELLFVLVSKIQAANVGVELNIPDITCLTNPSPPNPNEQPEDSMYQHEKNTGSDE